MAIDISAGLTGLRTAQKAMITIGHNIANANTEGYSKQTPVLTTELPAEGDFGTLGQGVKLARIERSVADFLNVRLYEKNSDFSKLDLKSSRLTDLEGVYNEPSDFGIKNSISDFFDSVHELAKNPENNAVRIQMLERSKAMANRFNLVSSDINSMLSNARTDIKNTITETNILLKRVADLNEKIATLKTSELTAHDLEDERDRTLTDLSKLIDITVVDSGDKASKVVSFSGKEIVFGGGFDLLGTKTLATGDIEVIFSSNSVTANAGGGEVKGLLDFQTSANNAKSRTDTLANQIIQEFNKVHSEGVGLDGGFTTITSKNAVSDADAGLGALNVLPFNITDGSFFVTVRATSTNEVVKTKIDINPLADSLNDIKDRISAITNMSASVVTAGTDNFLKIDAQGGFTFNFSSELDPNPGGIGGIITVDGQYTGSKNDVYSISVSSAGTIGTTAGLKLRVTDSGNTFTREFDIGDTYTGGNTIDIGDGLKVTLKPVVVGGAEKFNVDVLNDPDETNLLASLGLNTFFAGTKSSDMAVVSDVLDNGRLIAAASSNSVGDNDNANRMLALKTAAVVGNRTFSDHLTETITLVGLELEENDRALNGERAVLDSLASLKEQTVGVSIDEELSTLIQFEQMFNASARYITTVNRTVDRLLEI